jgi:hypothetical protein
MNDQQTNMQDTAPITERSNRKSLILGCGIGCLSTAIIFVIIAIFAVQWSYREFNKMTTELEQRGLAKVMAQYINVNEPVGQASLYIGQQVTLNQGARAEVAIISPTAEIHGPFSEKVTFYGNVLTIGPDAKLQKGLDVQAHEIKMAGVVHGEIAGQYDRIENACPANATSCPTTTAPKK